MKVREAALKYLRSLQARHSKVKSIEYTKLETQNYLTSPLFSNYETKLLFNLRSRTNDAFKCNFRHLYGENIYCPLKCCPESPLEDSQKHLLICSKLKIETTNVARTQIEYNDIFKDVNKQKEVVTMYSELLEQKAKLIKEMNASPPGDKLDPTSSIDCCCGDAFFTNLYCLNCISSGN